MKLLFAIVLGVSLPAPNLQAAIELSGIFVMGDEARFVLVDPDSGESSGSLAIGDEFAGYELRNYEREQDVLVLTRDGVEYRLRLRDVTIGGDYVVFSGTIRLGAEGETQQARVRLVNGQERAFVVTPDMTLFLKASDRADGTVVYRARFEKLLSGGRTEITRAPTVIARAGGTFAVSAGELEFALDPES